MTFSKKDIEFAKALAKYKNKWVALQNRKVVAYGDDLERVYKTVQRKKIKDYVFHLVPDKPPVMYGL